MEINKILNIDSYDFLREHQEFSSDVIYADPPYALGSEVIVRPDGKVDYKKANDFMNKWDMPAGDWWEKWFKEAYRVLKYGGYCVMFGMDRQLLLFKYYAHLAGFTEQQSLYWYFISNFPKATDLSKMIVNHFGQEREVIGQSAQKRGKTGGDDKVYQGGYNEGYDNITAPSSDLAKKYEGYKYSISPLKQTNETIMVFQKPYLTGSCLHDTLAYENGNNKVTCGALDIDEGRVPTNELKQSKAKPEYISPPLEPFALDAEYVPNDNGRFPAQTFVDSQTAKILDTQSGISKTKGTGYDFKKINQNNPSHNITNIKSGIHFDGSGGCSKILHKCDFEKDEHDLYLYFPKVNEQERNGGLDEFPVVDNRDTAPLTCTEDRLPYSRNPHPTLKPIELNRRILKLFKTPNPQKILYPFGGAGSEIIGGIIAGFSDWESCEINAEYIKIAEARISHWTKKHFGELFL